MKKVCLVVGLLLLLVGCGGGGGGGGGTGDTENVGGWSVTTLQLNTTRNGALATTDIKVPDGLYGDLFRITITEPTTVDILMESAEFDTILFLFEDEALQERNLDNWEPYLVTYSLSGHINKQLPAGSYVIMATGWPGDTGAYSIAATLANISATASYVQFRSFEVASNDKFMAWIQFDNNGQDIKKEDIASLKLFGPSGAELVPSAPLQFIDDNYVNAVWNSAYSRFDQSGSPRYSGFLLDLSNYTDLIPGLYTFQVQAANGQAFDHQVDFPGKTVAPVVASSSMTYQWGTDGSLTLSWTEPSASFDQYRVYLTDQSGNVIFFGLVLQGSQVKLSADLVQQISQLAQITGPTTVKWSMRTRNIYSGSNYAQGISNAVNIQWPAPL